MSTETSSTENEVEYAGFWIRTGSAIIDTIIILIITLPLLFLIYGDAYLENEELVLGTAHFIISYMFPIMAIIIFWIYKAATPGKMAVSTKVVDAKTGANITASQSLIRYIGYYISIIPLGLGILWVGWDKRKQGWHDKIAGTVLS